MSDPIVADVAVREVKGRRITTITVIEGRQGNVWTARATSVPPIVRAELKDWLATAETSAAVDDDGGVHVGAGAHLNLADEGPGVEASADDRIGFVAPKPAQHGSLLAT